MPVNKVRRLGSFAPLSSRYFYDAAILAAGEKAEVLFTRGLAFSSGELADGVISDTQVMLLVGVGLTGVKARADRLVEVGLWERVDGGYRVRSWLKWNRSLVEIQGALAADSERKRNGTQPESEPDSGAVPNGFQPRARHTGARDQGPGTRGQGPATPEPPGDDPPTPATTGTPPPPRTCPKHPDGTERPCRACQRAREAHEAWAAEQRGRIAVDEPCPTHRGQLARNCALCRSEAIAS